MALLPRVLLYESGIRDGDVEGEGQRERGVGKTLSSVSVPDATSLEVFPFSWLAVSVVCFPPPYIRSHAQVTLRQSSGTSTAETAKLARKPRAITTKDGPCTMVSLLSASPHPKVGVASQHARPQDPLTSPFPAIVPPASPSENFPWTHTPCDGGGRPEVGGR